MFPSHILKGSAANRDRTGQLNVDLANSLFAKKCDFSPFKVQYWGLTCCMKLLKKILLCRLAVPEDK